ncbi:MAG: hypothetical protein IT249_02825 [Chitinophagaceae bacterium]|nr:hypothetical protein [Chitinophagaceae bacterium]
MIFSSSTSRTLCVALAAYALIASCKKDARKTETSDAQNQETVASVSASATAYSALNTALDIMFVTGAPESESGRVTSGRKYGCATVTASPGGLVDFPKNVLVDFGTGCTLRGYNAKGSISFKLDQWISIPGTEVVPVFNNFYVNGYKIEGDYKITAISATEFKIDIIDGIITIPNGTAFHLKGVQHYTQTAGSSTPLVFGDDIYSITGNISSTSSLGDIDGTITSPLVKEVACNNITAGKVDFKTTLSTATLDFGDGTCDNKGTIYIGPLSFPVTLPF